MGFGYIELFTMALAGLLQIGVPIAVVVFFVVIYRKLDRIERRLDERDNQL